MTNGTRLAVIASQVPIVAQVGGYFGWIMSAALFGLLAAIAYDVARRRSP